MNKEDPMGRDKLPDSLRIMVASNGEEHEMVRVRKLYTTEAKHFRTKEGAEGRPYFTEEDVRKKIECGLWTWIDKPFEIPASPFYVDTFGGFSYKVEVDGLFYSLTCLENGSHWPRHAETRKIPGHFNENRWKLIDPPTPAVDPVVAATAEVQRLLREYQAAVKAGDEADAVAEKAAEQRRNIGKQLEAAKRELEKANHEAVGIEFSDKFGANYS